MQAAAKTEDFAVVKANKKVLENFHLASSRTLISSRTPTSSALRPSKEEAMLQVCLLEQNIRVADSIIAGLRSNMTQVIAQFRVVEGKLKELEQQLETEKTRSAELAEHLESEKRKTADLTCQNCQLDEMRKILVDHTKELQQQLKDSEIVHLAHNESHESDFIESSLRKYGGLSIASTLLKALKMIPTLSPPPFWLKTDRMSSSRWLLSKKNWRKSQLLLLILTASVTISKLATLSVVQLASARLARKSSLENGWNLETTPLRSMGFTTAEAQTPASWLPLKPVSDKESWIDKWI